MQGIPGEDGEVVVPFLVHGGMAAAEGRLVHDVVVHQGEIVEELYGEGRRQRLFPGSPAGLACRHDQHRSQPLAPQAHEVADRSIQFGVGVTAQELGTPRFEGESVLGHGRLGIEGLGHQSPRSSCWWMYRP